MAKTVKKATKRPASSAAKPTARKPAGLGKKLVVVESPAKAKTINRYLGTDYVVRASMGHVRDLPVRQLGVDVANDFQPTYEPLSGREKVLTELRKYAKAATEVFLATDRDREGEAIAWHLAESLRLGRNKIRRVVFNEITRSAIVQAFGQPHDIDMNKVNAQQARRILDRIVGYEISPLLWKKVAPGLSAGRVQSVAVRLIVERERQIDAFVPEEHWRIGAIFTTDLAGADKLAARWAEFISQLDEKGNPPSKAARQKWLADSKAFTADLVSWRGEPFKADTVEGAVEAAKGIGLVIDEVLRTTDEKGKGPARNLVTVSAHLGDLPASFAVSCLRQRDSRSRPPAPFTTASLQQAAASQLRFSASRTMRLAQGLYEGVDVPGEGQVGLITYMRTDSTHLSAEAVKEARSMIADTFGDAYVPAKPNVFVSKGRAQEAHEAIRPTDVNRTGDDLRGALNADQFKLYDLIWKRFVASQMESAQWKTTEAEIVAEAPAGQALFKAVGRALVFDGYLRVAGLPRNGEQILPDLAEDQPVCPLEMKASQHFTQPPPRYSEASLVRALEADGIGRPSTYAAIIQTIQQRDYVRLIERVFRPTDLGVAVINKLVKHFPELFDVGFTAEMENRLDRVEDASTDWVRLLHDFYGPFAKALGEATENMVHAKAEAEPSDYTCDTCGKPMVYRFSKNGRYLACTGYPDCKTTHPVGDNGEKLERVEVDVPCPKCAKNMMLRRSRFGPFLGCSDYPNCRGTVPCTQDGKAKLQ